VRNRPKAERRGETRSKMVRATIFGEKAFLAQSRTVAMKLVSAIAETRRESDTI
jgi:hypothetical protein